MSDSRYRRRAPTPVALLGASLQVGFATGRLVVRPVIACVGAGLRIEREARSAIGDAMGRSVLEAIDSVLATPYAEEAVDRVLAAPIAERALERALSGPLVEALARDVVRYAVVERVAEAVFTGDTLDRLMVLALD